MRWKHPKRGSIPPSVFIPVAEETGMIIALGQKILDMACIEAATWPNNIKVAVNLSPVQFKDPSLVLHIASALAKSGLRAQRLELEVTERLLLEESEETRVAIKHFEELGVSLSLDDFGTGYSSLNYLHKFPFHKIKIDQSFVRNREADRDARAIVEAVANLGASLGKIVVAEGIETEKEMDMVKSLGVHQGQGYFFSRADDRQGDFTRSSKPRRRRRSSSLRLLRQLVADRHRHLQLLLAGLDRDRCGTSRMVRIIGRTGG